MNEVVDATTHEKIVAIKAAMSEQISESHELIDKWLCSLLKGAF